MSKPKKKQSTATVKEEAVVSQPMDGSGSPQKEVGASSDASSHSGSSPDVNAELNEVAQDSDKDSGREISLSIDSGFTVGFWNPSDPLNRVAIGGSSFSLLGDNVSTIKEVVNPWTNSKMMSFIQQNLNFGSITIPSLPYMNSDIYSTKGKYSSVSFREDFKLPTDVTNLRLLRPRVLNVLLSLNIHGFEVSDYSLFIGDYVNVESGTSGKPVSVNKITKGKMKTIFPLIKNGDTLFDGKNSTFNARFTPHSSSASWKTNAEGAKENSDPLTKLEIDSEKLKPIPYDAKVNGLAVDIHVKEYFYNLMRFQKAYAANIYKDQDTKVDLLATDPEAFVATFQPLVDIGTLLRILLHALQSSLSLTYIMANKQGVLSPYAYSYATLKPFQRATLLKNISDLARITSTFPYNIEVVQQFTQNSKLYSHGKYDEYDNIITSHHYALQCNISTDWNWKGLGKKSAVDTCLRLASRIGSVSFFVPTYETYAAVLSRIFGLMPRIKDSSQTYDALVVSATELTTLQFGLLRELLLEQSNLVRFLFDISALTQEWIEHIRKFYEQTAQSSIRWDAVQEPDLSLITSYDHDCNSDLLKGTLMDNRFSSRSMTGFAIGDDPELTMYNFVYDIKGELVSQPYSPILKLVTDKHVSPKEKPTNSIAANLVSVVRLNSVLSYAYIVDDDLKLRHAVWSQMNWPKLGTSSLNFTSGVNQKLSFSPVIAFAYNWSSQWANALRNSGYLSSDNKAVYPIFEDSLIKNYSEKGFDSSKPWLLSFNTGLNDSFYMRHWLMSRLRLLSYVDYDGNVQDLDMPTFSFNVHVDIEKLFMQVDNKLDDGQ